MFTELDSHDPRKDSMPPSMPKGGRSQTQPKLTPLQREREIEAREFIDAISAYPIGRDFNLWNLQGGWAIRLSCKRRGKYPSQLDFEVELDLALKYEWLAERPEDEDFTDKRQEMYRRGPIRYGATFVRVASLAAIKAQRAQFVSEFVKARPVAKGSVRPEPVSGAALGHLSS
jgi:hypothetical protein